MINILKKLVNRYEEWAEPSFDDWQQRIFDWQHDWLIQIHLSPNDHRLHYQMAWDLRVWNCPTKRSWWAPWKKYKFIWLLKPKSVWSILISSPLMFDTATGKELRGYDIAQLYIDVHSNTAKDANPWFAPFGSSLV